MAKRNEEARQYWKREILEASTSGLSIAEWCRRRNLSLDKMRYWKKVLVKTGDILPDIFSSPRHQSKVEYWRNIVVEAEASGLGAREWCEKNHVAYGTFKGWRLVFVKNGELPTGICSTRYRTAERWKKIFLEANASGLNFKEWCKQNNISYAALLYWKDFFISKGIISPTELRRSLPLSKEERKAQLFAAHNSGLSLVEWCQQNDISYGCLLFWRTKLLRQGEISPGLCNIRISHDAAFWKAQILEAAESNLSMAEWCRQRQISYTGFKHWREVFIETEGFSADICKIKSNAEEHWTQRILEADASGLSMLEWCYRNQIVYGTFKWWKRRLVKLGKISSNVCNHCAHHSRPYWKELILTAAASNLTMKEWCAQNHVRFVTLQAWGRRFIKDGELPQEVGEKLVSHLSSESSPFYELPLFLEERRHQGYISKGAEFRVGKFRLSVEADIPETMLNAALEMLNTVTEVFNA